jgi:hypothetical protein
MVDIFSEVSGFKQKHICVCLTIYYCFQRHEAFPSSTRQYLLSTDNPNLLASKALSLEFKWSQREMDSSMCYWKI